ncbi:MAG: DUF63 family protein [Candidatus Micrarchaeota archaeon]
MNETDWIDEFLVKPITHQGEYAPYNVVNTIVYAVIALAAAYLIYRGLKKLGIKIDERFFKTVLPFVLIGGLLRVFEDAAILPRTVNVLGFEIFPFVTPGIYILTFITLVACFAAAKARYKRDWIQGAGKIGGVVAFVLAIGLLATLKIENALPVLGIVALACFASVAFRVYRKNKAAFEEYTTVFSQTLDGAATFIGVSFLGYGEQHIVGNAIFDYLGGPLAFLIIKIAFAALLVEVVKREKAKPEEKTFILLLVTIFGLAPGIRDLTRMLFGV